MQENKTSFFDRPLFGLLVAITILFAMLCVAYFIDFVPGLTGLNVSIYSGVKPGGYNATVENLSLIAARKKGTIRNIPTNGSFENLKLLGENSALNAFALVQTGLPVPDSFELVARLSKSEAVFFFGPNAFAIKNFSDLKNKRIGVGPEGSGSAYFARTIYEKLNMRLLGVQFVNDTMARQMQLLKSGELDLVLAIFADNAPIVRDAILHEKMQFATFRQADSIAKNLHFLRTAYIREGYYDAIRNIPASDKLVLKLDTMLLCKKGARRSQIIGLLSALYEHESDLIIFNNTIPNLTGVAYHAAAKDFFANQGPEIFDVYAPRLRDFIPLGNLVQILMAISILFNLMAVTNRFFLWRIDANRVMLESEIQLLFARPITAEEIAQIAVEENHRSQTVSAKFDDIILRLTQLAEKCRKKSISLLVPMGKEQAYRYQEEIINRVLSSLKAYRRRF